MRVRRRHLLVLSALLVSACGGGSGQSGSAQSPGHHQRPGTTAGPVLRTLTASSLGTLPAPVMDPAYASLADGRLVLLGGLTPAQTSTDAVVVLDGGHAAQAGALPNAQHDAQAAALGSNVYVFGGGQFSEYDHILSFSPSSASASQVGTLPQASSDVAVASIGNTAYVVGGYNGAEWLDTILAWSPGGTPRVVARLPRGLRYAAVTAANGRIIIVGGTLDSGPSDEILSFDPTRSAVTPLSHLPVPLTHASAVYLDGRVIVIGGRRQLTGSQTTSILAIDPKTGRVSQVGTLPQPLSDTAVGLSGGRIIVAGGDDGNGAQSAILALTPKTGA